MSDSFEQSNLQRHLNQLSSDASIDRLAGATGLAALALRGQVSGAARTRRATSGTPTENLTDESILASARKALTDENTEVRRSLAFSLGELRNKAALEMLAMLADRDTESTVRAESVEGIAKIGGSQSVKIILRIVEQDRSIEVRLRGIRTLSALARREPDTREVVTREFDRMVIEESSDLVRNQIRYSLDALG